MTENAPKNDADGTPLISAQALIAEIQAAFKGVSREGGLSWSQCVALDHYEDPTEARKLDTDTHWLQLVDDVKWQPFPGIGGFSFIDAEGFLYYLPPTMIRFVRGDRSAYDPDHLLGSIRRFFKESPTLFDPAMRRVLSRFMMYMARHDREMGYFDDQHNPWQEALDLGWQHYLNENG